MNAMSNAYVPQISRLASNDKRVCSERLYPDKSYYCRRRAIYVIHTAELTGTFIEDFGSTGYCCEQHIRRWKEAK